MSTPILAGIKFMKAMPRLPVADARRTVAFYTEMLGFNLGVLWPEDRPAFLILERDGVRLAFDVVEGHRAQPDASSMGFYLEVEDVRAIYRAIQERVRVEWGRKFITTAAASSPSGIRMAT